ncbi:MAG: proton-conducting transporter membrane subunit [Acidimicrobiales bacterium]
MYLVLTAGVAISFLTGDLFNLFVGFEVMLTASYVLITLGGSREQVRAAMSYVVISLVASMLFLTAVAFTYAATGTVNLADLALRLDAIDPEVRRALGLLFLVVFGIKAAIFPLFFRLPGPDPTAPAPGDRHLRRPAHQVGVYAIIRTQTLLFPSSGASRLLLFVAAATMLIGVLRGNRSERRETHPQLPHRQPDRLHGLRAGVVLPDPAWRRRSYRPPHRGEPRCSWWPG